MVIKAWHKWMDIAKLLSESWKKGGGSHFGFYLLQHTCMGLYGNCIAAGIRHGIWFRLIKAYFLLTSIRLLTGLELGERNTYIT